MIAILATTLREGEYKPYISFTTQEKLKIARLLDQVGVEMIEAGDPSFSPSIAAAVEKVAGLVTPNLGGSLSTSEVTGHVIKRQSL